MTIHLQDRSLSSIAPVQKMVPKSAFCVWTKGVSDTIFVPAQKLSVIVSSLSSWEGRSVAPALKNRVESSVLCVNKKAYPIYSHVHDGKRAVGDVVSLRWS